MDTLRQIEKFKTRFPKHINDIIYFAYQQEDLEDEEYFELCFFFAKQQGLIDKQGNMLFKDFEDLEKLRDEIVLNSHYIADYENSFGFDARDVSIFFDGYMDYIAELCEEDNHKTELEDIFTYDNIDNLLSWFNCYDDLSWVKYVGKE